MQNMQQHSITNSYLKRRSTLLNIQHHQPNIRTQPNLQQEQLYLIQFAEACNNSPSLSSIYRVVSRNKQFISHYPAQIISILQSLLEKNIPSKISNIIFCICKNSPGFIKEIQKWVQKIIQKQKNWSQLAILTDLFLFGVYLTQQQFINDIFCFILNRVQKNKVHAYINHFMPVLLSNKFLNRKNQQKVYTQLISQIKKNVKHLCEQEAENLEQSLGKVQRSIINEDSQQIKVQEDKYKQIVWEFENSYNMLGNIVNELHRVHQSANNAFTFMGKQRQLEEIVKMSRDLTELANQRNVKRILSMSKVETNIKQIQEDLQHFPKSNREIKLYSNQIQKQLYNMGEKGKLDPKYIETISQFIKSILHCETRDESQILYLTFMQHLNTYPNRIQLVQAIFKLQNHNNIPYISRVIALISLQEEQIKELVLSIFHSSLRQSLKYIQYYPIFIQCTKFQLINAHIYLSSLLQHIQKIDVEETLNIIESLGRSTYYSNAKNHIKFNQILDDVEAKIKKSALNIPFLNRFNSILSHLRKHQILKEKQTNQKLIILEDQLKNVEYLDDVVRKFQKKVKQGKTNQLLECLHSYIFHSNYMYIYDFADIIYKVNSKNFDKSVINLTKQSMKETMEEQNIQGSCKWSHFLGQLYSSQVVPEKQFHEILSSFLNQYFDAYPSPTIKVICSAIDTCKHFMIKTKSIKCMNQSLLLLLNVKKQILKVKVLSNKIVQDEIAEIINYFNPNLIINFNSIEDIQEFQTTINSKSNVQQMINTYELKKSFKFVELKNRYSTPQTSSTMDDQVYRQLQKLSPIKIKEQFQDESGKGNKKVMKIISRNKNGNKLQAKQIQRK